MQLGKRESFKGSISYNRLVNTAYFLKSRPAPSVDVSKALDADANSTSTHSTFQIPVSGGFY